MALPQNLTLDQMQNKWASFLDPILKKPVVNGNILKEVSLVAGTNVINHLLSRQMQGWFVVDINAAALIYRSQPFNSQTLTLVSDANCIVNLFVF